MNRSPGRRSLVHVMFWQRAAALAGHRIARATWWPRCLGARCCSTTVASRCRRRSAGATISRRPTLAWRRTSLGPGTGSSAQHRAARPWRTLRAAFKRRSDCGPARLLSDRGCRARRGDQPLGRDVLTFQRMDGVAENFHIEQNRELLDPARGADRRQVLAAAGTPGPAGRDCVLGSWRDHARNKGPVEHVPVFFLTILALQGSQSGCCAGSGASYDGAVGAGAAGRLLGLLLSVRLRCCCRRRAGRQAIT